MITCEDNKDWLLLGDIMKLPFSNSAPETRTTPSSRDWHLDNRALSPQGPDFSICFLSKTLQAVGSLEAKATGAFRRNAAMRMPNRMSKYGLKRPDIFFFLPMNSVFNNSNPRAN